MKCIRTSRKYFEGRDVYIGAGTVKKKEEIDVLSDMGVPYILTPGFDEQIVRIHFMPFSPSLSEISNHLIPSSTRPSMIEIISFSSTSRIIETSLALSNIIFSLINCQPSLWIFNKNFMNHVLIHPFVQKSWNKFCLDISKSRTSSVSFQIRGSPHISRNKKLFRS